MATTMEAPKTEIVPLARASAAELGRWSRERGWSLSNEELAAAQTHFKSLRRDPTAAEMETLAQTWSEHCKHKTLTGPIRYAEGGKTRRFANLLRETIMDATRRLAKPWCLSVFEDNAGIIRFNNSWALAYKVETHNHPCAIEPYGGAATGIGGVIRDVLGAGLGAKPILNTDVFCVAPPNLEGDIPDQVLHPRRTLAGVVAGVRDYGNRMGIPTAAGALWFDPEYLCNPLVFCGTVGIMPLWAVGKEVKPGDLIVTVGGRTGRDGLRGATFSSAPLDDNASSAAVQIGHAIAEKRLMDGLLRARDRKLYRAVTDCGAGGFSSAIGELGASCGALVRLEKAPLKTSDMAPWEIWMSESQERMILAVPPKNLKPLIETFAAEDSEAAVLGEFTNTQRLVVRFHEETVVDLDMKFLHDGMPRRERPAVWKPAKPARGGKAAPTDHSVAHVSDALHALLGHLNVCSRAWIIRQYDHEVQGGALIKPLQGAEHDGPGDACVIWPHAATGNVEDFRGLAVSHGLNPNYGKIDPYAMALLSVDEALRNLTCVGADVSQAALLDNFCWGNPEDPAVLGSLVRAALGCRDAALDYEAPFISGKDSLYNQYLPTKTNGKELQARSIPGTLLISAIAPISDARKAVTMDFKAPNNSVYLIGRTAGEWGGSLYAQWASLAESPAPKVECRQSKTAMRLLSSALAQGLAVACHDLSEGGLAVALAEMAFSGEIGATIDLDLVPRPRELQNETALLFSESASRFLVEVPVEKEKLFLKAMRGSLLARIGSTIANPVLRWTGLDGSLLGEEPLSLLKAAWVRPLPAAMGARRVSAVGGNGGRSSNGHRP